MERDFLMVFSYWIYGIVSYFRDRLFGTPSKDFTRAMKHGFDKAMEELHEAGE